MLRHDILYCCQFGFRKNHSTSHTLIHLVNKIASAIDPHKTTVGVFLDLSRAFDTLDHQILFAKLEHYGICVVALQWFKSYFSCRQQFIHFDQACSPMQTIKCGVPQGSILGPLLFILYINDLPDASELTDPLLFANDSSIFYSHSNPNCLESVLNDELQNIDIWLKCNKLSVNVKKTHYVIFKPRQKKFNASISLSFGVKALEQSNITGGPDALGKYLFILRKNLSPVPWDKCAWRFLDLPNFVKVYQTSQSRTNFCQPWNLTDLSIYMPWFEGKRQSRKFDPLFLVRVFQSKAHQDLVSVELVKAKPGEPLAPIDKIAIVCCALTNLSESILPFDWCELTTRLIPGTLCTIFHIKPLKM